MVCECECLCVWVWGWWAQYKKKQVISSLRFFLFLSFSLSLSLFSFFFFVLPSFSPSTVPSPSPSLFRIIKRAKERRRGERGGALFPLRCRFMSPSPSPLLSSGSKKIKQTKNKKTLRTLHVPPGIPSSANTCVFFLSISAAAAVSDVFALLATSKALSCILWALS